MSIEIIDWVTGDMLGLPIPAHLAALREGGAAYLTHALHATGALDADNAVVGVAGFQDWLGGGTGSKARFDVVYAAPTDLPTALFVKFSRNFTDPIYDRTRYHMRPEVRLAALSREPGFPIAVPTCMLADFHEESGTGILLTARIPYGQGIVEPQYPKCLDHLLPEPLDHYRALIRTVASLGGAHKGGKLPAAVAERFPFDRAVAEGENPIPAPDKLAFKLDRLRSFVETNAHFFPEPLSQAPFLDRFAEGARLFQRHEAAIKCFLHADPLLIALCHWNANIDNAWFWPEADGTLACGLMDWGSVGQMNLAMTIWGCLSGAETWLWNEHYDDLITLFVESFEAAGGPTLDQDTLRLHVALYVGMMGLAWLLDAPPRILRELPDLAEIGHRLDPRLTANETARVQLLILTNVLNLWHRDDTTRLIAERFGSRIPYKQGR